ncbi:MAG TPA: hypothetical protein VE912_02125 [Bacteroidales bacterium]|nr:hypothetical protein [Balneolales bacterium]HYX05509.1 hypothetical protein [Bacteroidales bacterium]
MGEIKINKEEFKLFDQDDQFGFFYDDEGWPRSDAEMTFDSDIDKLYEKYDYVVVDDQDNIYGEKNGKKELLMDGAIEAFSIAEEVKHY